MKPTLFAVGATSVLILLSLPSAARAQQAGQPTRSPDKASVPGMTPQPAPQPSPPPAPDDPTAIWKRSNLLGDMGGLRSRLTKAGVTLGLTEVSEILGNVSGGFRQGATYDGLTTLTLTVDTEKALRLKGGTFNVSGLQIHGRSLSEYYIGNLQTVSGIEADPATRLWELWYQQELAGGKADIKIGQQSLDQEYMSSANSALYLNTMMGWPLVPSVDLYAGGPAYPLASLGIRLRVQPNDKVSALIGVFNDNPPGGTFNNDSQLRGREGNGLEFNLNTGALIIGEVQYAANQSAPASCTTLSCGLPAIYKLGIWFDTAKFLDQRFDTNGLSLADPASNGKARVRRHNFSIYAVIDQMVWREAEGGPRSVSLFARPMGAPGNRNLIDLSLNAGVNVKAPLRGRDNDTFGIGYGIGHVSARAQALDRDTALFTGTAYPVRSSEQFVELTYQMQVAPWWQVQPDFQYIFNVGAGVQNPRNTAQRIKDAAVIGLRTTIVF